MGCLPNRESSLEDCSQALLSFYTKNSDTWRDCFEFPEAAGPLQTGFANLSFQSLTESVERPETSHRLIETIQLFKGLVWATRSTSTGLKRLEDLDPLLHANAALRYETLQLLYYLYEQDLREIPEKLKATIRQMRARLPSYSRLQVTNGQIYLLSLVLLGEASGPIDIENLHQWILEAFYNLLDCQGLVGMFALLIARKDDIVATHPFDDTEKVDYIRHLPIIDLEIVMKYLSLFDVVDKGLLRAVFAANPHQFIGMHGISNTLCGLVQSEGRLKLFLEYSNAKNDITAVLELCNQTVQSLTEDNKISSAQSVLKQVLTYIPPNMPKVGAIIQLLSTSFKMMGILDVSNHEFASNYIDQLIAYERDARILKNIKATLQQITFCLWRHCGLPLYEDLLVKYITHIINGYQFVEPPFEIVSQMIAQCCNWLPQILPSVLSELRSVISQSSEDKSKLELLESELSTQVDELALESELSRQVEEQALESEVSAQGEEQAPESEVLTQAKKPIINFSTAQAIRRLACVFPLNAGSIQSTEQRKPVLEECMEIVKECKSLGYVDYEDVPLAGLNDSRIFPKILLGAIKVAATDLKTLLEEAKWVPDEQTLRTWRIQSVFLEKFANSLFFRMLFLKATQKPLCCYILTEFVDLLLVKIDWKVVDLDKANMGFAYYAVETKIMAAALHGFQAPSKRLAMELATVAKSKNVAAAFNDLGISTESFDDLLNQIYFTSFPILDFGKTIYGGILLLSDAFLSGTDKHRCAMKVTLCHELAHASRRLISERFQVGRMSPVVEYRQGMIGRLDLQTVVSDDAEGGKALENQLFGAFITWIGPAQIAFLCNPDSWKLDLCGFKDRLEVLGANESGEPMKLYRCERGHMSFDRTDDKPCSALDFDQVPF